MFKKFPRLSEGTKNSLVRFWPICTALSGLLTVILARRQLGNADSVDQPTLDYANQLYDSAGNQIYGATGSAEILIYIAVILQLASAIIMLMAIPKLHRRRKSGWDLLLLAFFTLVAFTVFSALFLGGIVILAARLLLSALVLYLLFQIRDKYAGGRRITAAKDISR